MSLRGSYVDYITVEGKDMHCNYTQ